MRLLRGRDREGRSLEEEEEAAGMEAVLQLVLREEVAAGAVVEWLKAARGACPAEVTCTRRRPSPNFRVAVSLFGRELLGVTEWLRRPPEPACLPVAGKDCFLGGPPPSLGPCCSLRPTLGGLRRASRESRRDNPLLLGGWL